METIWNRIPSNAARSLGDAVAEIIAPLEERKRTRRQRDRQKYETTLATFVDLIANIALDGRGWVAQSFSNDVLKQRGGPGRCLATIRDGLKAAGLIEIEPGFKDHASGRGRVTRVRATLRFRGLAREHGYSRLPPDRTTILPGEDGPLPQTLVDQDAIVHAFNRFAADHRLRCAEGYSPPDVYLVRKFKGDWNSGGRLYGGYWQDLSKSERLSLRIDGEPVAEIDFRTMQPRILFGLKGLPLDFDPYLVPGFDIDRETGKLVYNRLVNRNGKAVRTCPINFTDEFRNSFVDRDSFRRFVLKMEERLSPVAECFGKNPWRVLQKEESELLLSILRLCLNEGMPAYPVHDSLIVKSVQSERARRIMLSEFKYRYGVEAEVS